MFFAYQGCWDKDGSRDIIVYEIGLVFVNADVYKRQMLNFLRKKIKVPQEKFFVNMEMIGNTVSNSIPIALYAPSSVISISVVSAMEYTD